MLHHWISGHASVESLENTQKSANYVVYVEHSLTCVVNI